MSDEFNEAVLKVLRRMDARLELVEMAARDYLQRQASRDSFLNNALTDLEKRRPRFPE